MLPYLKNKQGGGSMTEETMMRKPDDESTEISLKYLADELIKAIETKSPEATAEAFEAMFLFCESKPHDEA
jgi:hypothetical protein